MITHFEIEDDANNNPMNILNLLNSQFNLEWKDLSRKMIVVYKKILFDVRFNTSVFLFVHLFVIILE